jgi:hypothetical protein
MLFERLVVGELQVGEELFWHVEHKRLERQIRESARFRLRPTPIEVAHIVATPTES